MHAHHLPFRDNCFKIVYASHVIEQCLDPKKVIEEFRRVSSMAVIIKVMNAKVDYACKTHFLQLEGGHTREPLESILQESGYLPFYSHSPSQKPPLQGL